MKRLFSRLLAVFLIASPALAQLPDSPTGRGGTPFDISRPEITVVSNVIVDGKPTGALGNSELVWHQDMTYNELPAKASLLYGITVPPSGGDTWFFLTADYAFGHSLEEETMKIVEESGGEVVGSVRHPFPATDFSSFLLQAQASGADVIGLANAGGDTVNAIKQASEFGITQSGQSLAALLMFITDVHALGAETAQGLVLTEAFYQQPQHLKREQPDVYAALCRFYRIDPEHMRACEP